MPVDVEGVQILIKRLAPKWPLPVKYIGGGVNGRVFETNNGRYMKIVTNNSPQEWESLLRLQGTRVVPRFRKENQMKLTVPLKKTRSAVAETLNIPKKRVGGILTIFIMGRVGGGDAMTLFQYLKKFPNTNKSRIQNRVFSLIEEMHVRGISHGNLHAGNILVTADSAGRITGMWVIDFGRSTKIPLGNTERTHYMKMGKTGNFNTANMYSKPGAFVPVFKGSRANVHMANIHYGKKFIRPRENILRNRRKSVENNLKNLKSPRKVTSVRRTRSASPVRRASPSVSHKRKRSPSN